MHRRHFLLNASKGAFLALPLLESLKSPLHAASPVAISPLGKSAAPKRAVFLAMGYGVTKETWYPDVKEVGNNYKIPPGLRPLEKHRDHMTIIQNLSHQFSNDGHCGSTFWLTGANRYAIPGQSFYNSISADQVIAEQFGEQTRYASVQIHGAENGDGHGHGGVAWNEHGKPLAADTTSLQLYHRLFSGRGASPEQTKVRLRKDQSVLDALLADAKTVQTGLSKRDTDKLDEYFQSVREIENRLAKEKRWLNEPLKKPSVPVKVPAETLRGIQEMKTVYDLIALAMEVDASRVFTYQLPVETLIADLGAEISAHSMSHYVEGERRIVSEKRDLENARLLARFLDRLEASKDIDGSSLLDNTVVTFGSNLSTIHNLRNCPTVVAGGGAGFKHGRNIVMDQPQTPLCNLWLSIIQGLGVKADSHGDSTGVIDELFS